MAEEIKKTKGTELTKEQAEKVSGGDEVVYFTKVRCYTCGHGDKIEGNFGGQLLECPICHNKTYEGMDVEVWD